MVLRLVLINILLCLSLVANAQSEAPDPYSTWVTAGDSLYKVKQYKAAALAFSKAFAALAGNGLPYDKYNAACSWALAGNKDSAFKLLKNIANASFSDLDQLNEDADLISLHSDKRWKHLCATVQANKDEEEANLNKPLVATLDTIFRNDQRNRNKMQEVAIKYGQNSKEIDDLWKEQNHLDSLDLVKVIKLLDKYGWLGMDVVGRRGNETIFLVIQHADIKTQQKYLPVMREAVLNNKAEPSALALLEDRVALHEGRKQKYGSQIHGSPDGHYWVSPIEDPDNVDKRRAEVNLMPMANYLKQWNIKWDVAEYKKQLPEIEKKDKW